jgi:hypothetical protein
MKKLFENGWVTLGMMFAVAIADLIGANIQFGAGFVLALLYFIVFIYRK